MQQKHFVWLSFFCFAALLMIKAVLCEHQLAPQSNAHEYHQLKAGVNFIVSPDSNNNHFEGFDVEMELFRIEGNLDPDGNLDFSINTENYLEGKLQVRSRLHGTQMFMAMMKHFKGRVKIVRGRWEKDSNLKTYKEGLQKGLTREEAAGKTWTGKRAASYGFTKVRIVSELIDESQHGYVLVEFRKPRMWIAQKILDSIARIIHRVRAAS